MNDAKTKLYRHIYIMRAIAFWLIVIFFLSLFLRPILIEIKNNQMHYNDIIYKEKPFVVELSEVIVDGRSYVFTSPTKCIIRIVSDNLNPNNKIYRIEINPTL